jgi:hypothetical protein
MPEPSVDEDELLDTPLPGLLDICANLLTEVGHPVYPPRHATPRLASPRLATPHLVTLGHATPSHAVPRHASPRHRVSSTRLGILYIPELTLLDAHPRKKGNQRVHAPGSDQHVDPDVKGTAASACVRQRRCARTHPPIIPGGSRASSHHPWRFPRVLPSSLEVPARATPLRSGRYRRRHPGATGGGAARGEPGPGALAHQRGRGGWVRAGNSKLALNSTPQTSSS